MEIMSVKSRGLLFNLAYPRENVESLIFPDEFLNFTSLGFDINQVKIYL